MLRSASVFVTYSKFLVAIVAAACIFESCSSGSGLSASQNETNFTAEANFFNPQMDIHHLSDDSSSIILTIQPQELLYSRADKNLPFLAEISFHYEIKHKDSPANMILDSATVRFTDERYSASNRFVQFAHIIALPKGEWSVTASVIDLKRGLKSIKSFESNKSDILNADDFNFSIQGSPIYEVNNSVPQNTTIQITCPRNGSGPLYLFHYQPEIKLSTAPFSSNYPEIPAFKDFNLLQTDSTGMGVFLIEKGLYFVSSSLIEPIGISIFSVPKKFPEVKNPEQLVGPLRFITTKAEFDEISKSRLPKEKVDAFWIESGGAKDRAKNLIFEYYSRVEEANSFFSTYTEGWRTDRGMIHLIFGPPSSIKMNEETHTWIYGDENSSASLRFTFRKIQSPFSDNIFILNRDAVYKGYWENMVAAWRGGQVYH